MLPFQFIIDYSLLYTFNQIEIAGNRLYQLYHGLKNRQCAIVFSGIYQKYYNASQQTY